MLKHVRRNANKNITLAKSRVDSISAPIIFFNPGNFDTDRNGRRTLKLRRTEIFGTTEITLTELKNMMRKWDVYGV